MSDLFLGNHEGRTILVTIYHIILSQYPYLKDNTPKYKIYGCVDQVLTDTLRFVLYTDVLSCL